MSLMTLKGPYWVTVRQHRRAVWVTAAGAAVSLAVIGGLRLWDAQVPDVRADAGYWTAAEDRGFRGLITAMESASSAMVLLPLLVAVFVAGPLVARELESGTYKLAWTQAVTPVRWLAAKLLTAGGVAVAATLALTGVYAIGHTRLQNRAGFHWADRGPYEVMGTVLVAEVLLAVAVGALLGLLIRRTLVAMAATGVTVGLVLLGLGAWRWDFLPVQTVTGPAGGDKPLYAPDDAFLMDSGLLSGDVRVDHMSCLFGDIAEKDFKAAQEACFVKHDITGTYLDYHPSSHLWPTQLIETGILVALAALAAYGAFRLLRRRHV